MQCSPCNGVGHIRCGDCSGTGYRLGEWSGCRRVYKAYLLPAQVQELELVIIVVELDGAKKFKVLLADGNCTKEYINHKVVVYVGRCGQ